MSLAHEAFDFPIRRTKLRRPPLGDGLVPRPRLTAALDRSLRVPLTLVVAPAGFGKTTLLVEWSGKQTIPVAWLTVDATDRDLARFVAYVVAVIGNAAPEVAERLQSLTRNLPTSPADIGASLADCLLDLSSELVIVVDDTHLAASPEVMQVLHGLLQLAPPHLHLILGTRSDPALPLSQLRIRGHLHELRAGDLRFTDDEVRSLLTQTASPAHDPAVIAALQRQSGGWIAALRLAALTLPQGPDPAHAADRMATDEHLVAILLDEVLATQPAATQEFLRRTAIVDRICPALADALLDQPTGDGSRETLDGLLRAGLFIEAEAEDGAWSRYHPIFHRLLRHQAERHLPRDDLAQLHARASAWFAEYGRHDEAIRHRLLAGDAVGAAILVEAQVHPLLDREDWRRLDAWLRLLPASVMRTRPALLLATAWVSHLSGRMVPNLAIVAEVEALLAASDVDASTRQMLSAEGEGLVLAALLAPDLDPRAALARVRAVVARIPPAHRFPYGLAMYALGCALQDCGQTEDAVRWLTAAAERDEARIDAGSIRVLLGLVFVHRQAGHLDACAAVARHTLVLAEREGLPVARGWAHWALGWVAYEHDALDEAYTHFSAILADHHRVHLSSVSEASFGVARIAQARGDLTGADAALQRLQAIVLEANALEYLPWLRGGEASLALARGQTEQASNWLSAEGAALEDCSLHACAHPFLIGIKTRLAEGTVESLAQAQRDVAQIRAFAETHHHTGALVEILALDALVHDAQGQRPEALALLAQSLALGAPGRICRTYRDIGPRLAALLVLLADEGSPAAAALVSRGSIEDVPGAAMLDVLTLREAEVLQALARRLSNREIGEALFISLETVKSHTSNIYGKLGVASRREALARAHALGWTLPD